MSWQSRMIDRAEALADRTLRLPGAELGLRIIREVVLASVTDRAMTLAAQAFTSVLPILILLTTLPGCSIVSRAMTDLGLNRESLGIGSANSVPTTAFGVFGALMVIGGGTSLARALGRMYVYAWQVRKLPWQSWWRWVVVIFAIPTAAVAQGLVMVLGGATLSGVTVAGYGVLGVVLVTLATLVIWGALWTLVPRLLVSSQVPMRLLVLNGALTGIFVTALILGSVVVMPHSVHDTVHHFGGLGVVFIAISWLFFYAAIVVVSAIVVNTVVTDDGTIGRWVARRTGRPTPFPARPSASSRLIAPRDDI